MTCASTQTLTDYIRTVGQADSNTGYCSAFQLHVFLSVCALQKTADFSLFKSDTGDIVTEDGRSRCPFNPEYKSTAIMAGRSQNDWQLLIKSGFVSFVFRFIKAAMGISKITWHRKGTHWGRTSGFHYSVLHRSPFPLGKYLDYSGLFLSVADGELYAGTVSNFQGNEPIIYKSLSQGTSLKTENSLNWLQGTNLWLEGNTVYHCTSFDMKSIWARYVLCEVTMRFYVAGKCLPARP